MNTLQTIREGRSAVRQLRSLRDADALVYGDFCRLSRKVRAALVEANRPGVIERYVDRMDRLASCDALQDDVFQPILRELDAAFDRILGPEASAPPRPFTAIQGGRA